MRIVIDISEDDYRKVQDGRASVSMMLKAIRKGTPLDKIRAEMEQIKEAEYQIYGKGSWRFVDKCIDIIDKYKAESDIESKKIANVTKY